MGTETSERPQIVERAKRTVASRTVFIRADTTGVVPMERRLADGSKHISRCEYNQFGKMMNVQHVRPLNFGENGVQVINPSDVEDAELLRECKLWLEDGSDDRIRRFNIRIQEGGTAEGTPVPRYEKYKPEALIKRLTEELDLIADDPAASRDFLEQCARFELQLEKPRKKVLDAIDELGVASGVEYGLDAVEDE